MPRFLNILYPTDYSVCADHARRYALAFAKESGGILHVLHVVDTPKLTSVCVEGVYGGVEGVYGPTTSLESIIDSMRKDAQIRLESIRVAEEKSGVNSQHHIREGTPWRVISEVSEELDIDLIVIGTHGRSGFKKLFYGSTFEKLLRTTQTPVLSIKASKHDSVPQDSPVVLRKILCPVDFSDHSHSVLPIAADICRAHGASLTLCHIVDTHIEYPQFNPIIALGDSRQLLGRAKNMLNELSTEFSDIESTVHVTAGIPEIQINQLVKRAEIDLIVIASHGRSGFSHLVLGSMAEKVIRLVNCPILTIRPGKDRSKRSDGK